jgi:GDP-D-mannose dehydratase
MIGSHIARAMIKKGCYQVFGIVRLRSDLTALAGILNNIELFYGDITDSKRMIEVFKQTKPSLVFHFAAQAINGVSFSMPQLTLDANIQGTLNVLEAVRMLEHKPRVLVAGSSTEYGRTTDTYVGAIRDQ